MDRVSLVYINEVQTRSHVMLIHANNNCIEFVNPHEVCLIILLLHLTIDLN